jgi:hypothetical protein
MSRLGSSIGGLNKDGIAGVVVPDDGAMAIDMLPDGCASGVVADSFGRASGLAGTAAIGSGAALRTAGSI